MNRSKFSSHRKTHAARMLRNCEPVDEHGDMLARKETLCEELIRIDAVVKKLRHQRHIGPDVSSEDLLEIFCEERDRLFAQLRQLDALMTEADAESVDPVVYCRVVELRRAALVAEGPLDFQ